MSMEDTMQRRTLAVQESIRQTLAASYKNMEAELPPDAQSAFMNSLEMGVGMGGGGGGGGSCGGGGGQLQDFNIVDVLADPRWSGMKNGRGMDLRNENKRRDNGMVYLFRILSMLQDFNTGDKPIEICLEFQ